MIGRIIKRVCCLYYTFPGFGRTNSFNYAWSLDYYFYYYLCFCLNCLLDRNISIGGLKKMKKLFVVYYVVDTTAFVASWSTRAVDIDDALNQFAHYMYEYLMSVKMVIDEDGNDFAGSSLHLKLINRLL